MPMRNSRLRRVPEGSDSGCGGTGDGFPKQPTNSTGAKQKKRTLSRRDFKHTIIGYLLGPTGGKGRCAVASEQSRLCEGNWPRRGRETAGRAELRRADPPGPRSIDV